MVYPLKKRPINIIEPADDMIFGPKNLRHEELIDHYKQKEFILWLKLAKALQGTP